jgi:hypothetical protein
MLSGFQLTLYRHRHTLGIETPNWITLKCKSTGGGETLIGGFGAHFETKQRPLAARYGIGRTKAITAEYDTAHGHGSDLSVVRVPPNLPPPSALRITTRLTPHRRSLAPRVGVPILSLRGRVQGPAKVIARLRS